MIYLYLIGAAVIISMVPPEAATFSANEIFNYVTGGNWLVAASQQEKDVRKKIHKDIPKGDELYCLHTTLKVHTPREEINCSFPEDVNHTTTTKYNYVDIFGNGDEMSGILIYTVPVVTLSGYKPELFKSLVRGVTCDLKDSLGDKTVLVITRFTKKFVDTEPIPNCSQKLVVAITVNKKGKRTYRTAIWTREQRPKKEVQDLIQYYNQYYMSKVEELKLPTINGECTSEHNNCLKAKKGPCVPPE